MRQSFPPTHRFRRSMFNNALSPMTPRRRFALTHPASPIEHHGDSILRLAGIRRIVDWRPVPGEVVQPR